MKSVGIKYSAKNHGSVAHVVVDSTDLKVYGEGEWKTREHGKEKCRTWRKLRLAVDSSAHEAMSAKVTLVSATDNEVFPTLFNPLRRRIPQVSADGVYDTNACHKLLQRKGCKPTILLGSVAGCWEDGPQEMKL